MFCRLAVLSVVVVLLSPYAVGQAGPEGQPPATQPGQIRTPQDVLAIVENLMETAKDAMLAGRNDEAMQLLNDAKSGLELVLEADPTNIQAMALAGEFAARTGSHNQARQLFNQVRKVEPNNYRANLGLGRFYISSRLYRQAKKYLQDAQRVATRDQQREVLSMLAVCYNGENKHLEAVEAAEQAVAIDPENFDSLMLLIKMRLQARQLERAAEATRALAITAMRQRQAEPANPVVLQRLILAYETQANALKMYHNSLYQHDARGRVSDQIVPGREPEAAGILARLAGIAGEVARLRMELAYHDMLMLVEKAVNYEPMHTHYLMELATLLMATHQEQRAVEVYQRVVAISVPKDKDLDNARENQERARQRLEQFNVPLASQPAEQPVPAP